MTDQSGYQALNQGAWQGVGPGWQGQWLGGEPLIAHGPYGAAPNNAPPATLDQARVAQLEARITTMYQRITALTEDLARVTAALAAAEAAKPAPIMSSSRFRETLMGSQISEAMSRFGDGRLVP